MKVMYGKKHIPHKYLNLNKINLLSNDKKIRWTSWVANFETRQGMKKCKLLNRNADGMPR